MEPAKRPATDQQTDHKNNRATGLVNLVGSSCWFCWFILLVLLLVLQFILLFILLFTLLFILLLVLLVLLLVLLLASYCLYLFIKAFFHVKCLLPKHTHTHKYQIEQLLSHTTYNKHQCKICIVLGISLSLGPTNNIYLLTGPNTQSWVNRSKHNSFRSGIKYSSDN